MIEKKNTEPNRETSGFMKDEDVSKFYEVGSKHMIRPNQIIMHRLKKFLVNEMETVCFFRAHNAEL